LDKTLPKNPNSGLSEELRLAAQVEEKASVVFPDRAYLRA
jgi:hypothetical protein